MKRKRRRQRQQIVNVKFEVKREKGKDNKKIKQ